MSVWSNNRKRPRKDSLCADIRGLMAKYVLIPQAGMSVLLFSSLLSIAGQRQSWRLSPPSPYHTVCLGFLLTPMQNGLPASGVQLFSLPSHRLKDKSLSSTPQSTLSILQI